MLLSIRDTYGKFVNIPSIKGKDGKTPVKGVDYFTKEDIQELIDKINIESNVDLKSFLWNSVIQVSSLPTWEDEIVLNAIYLLNGDAYVYYTDCEWNEETEDYDYNVHGQAKWYKISGGNGGNTPSDLELATDADIENLFN